MRLLRWIPAAAAIGAIATAALMPPTWLIVTFGARPVLMWAAIVLFAIPLFALMLAFPIWVAQTIWDNCRGVGRQLLP